MTNDKRDNSTDKIDGRRLRTGKGSRGEYQRKQVLSEEDLYRRYVVLLMKIMEVLGVPEYRHARSNHIYSYREKIAMLVLRERMKLSYKQFVKDLPSFPGVLEELDLSSLPEQSTLCRFAKAVDPEDLQRIVTAFSFFVQKRCTLAIDGTGFSNFMRSAHFVKRCKQLGIKKEPRSFTKASYAGDVETHIIVSCRISPFRKHDVTFIPEHVKDLEGTIEPSFILMDKGYDSDAVHRFVRQRLGCITAIPARKSRKNYGYTTHGVYRRKMLEDWEANGPLRHEYRRRPQIETINFMVKIHNDSDILSRLEETRVSQGLFKVLSHNCKIVVERGWDLNYTK